MIKLRYLINSWKTLEIFLINCEFNLDLNWFKKCLIRTNDVAYQGATFSNN